MSDRRDGQHIKSSGARWCPARGSTNRSGNVSYMLVVARAHCNGRKPLCGVRIAARPEQDSPNDSVALNACGGHASHQKSSVWQQPFGPWLKIYRDYSRGSGSCFRPSPVGQDQRPKNVRDPGLQTVTPTADIQLY